MLDALLKIFNNSQRNYDLAENASFNSILLLVTYFKNQLLGRRTSRHRTTNFPEKLVNILIFFENGKIPIKII